MNSVEPSARFVLTKDAVKAREPVTPTARQYTVTLGGNKMLRHEERLATYGPRIAGENTFPLVLNNEQIDLIGNAG